MNVHETKYYLFSDASVDNQSKNGFGAYLFISEEDLFNEVIDVSGIVSVSYRRTSSSEMELKTLLHALNNNEMGNSELTVYTDSQNIVSLNERRVRLEANGFLNKKGVIIAKANLYKDFYICMDKFNCTILKIKGHSPKIEKNTIAKCFAMVDRLSRKNMRESRL